MDSLENPLNIVTLSYVLQWKEIVNLKIKSGSI